MRKNTHTNKREIERHTNVGKNRMTMLPADNTDAVVFFCGVSIVVIVVAVGVFILVAVMHSTKILWHFICYR